MISPRNVEFPPWYGTHGTHDIQAFIFVRNLPFPDIYLSVCLEATDI